MTRYIPAQIKLWTGGQLVQSAISQAQTDRFYRGISTDSRSLRAGEVFLALQGENFDGHRFAAEACKKGAGMLILQENSKEAMEIYHQLRLGVEMPDLLLVGDTLNAYHRIAEGFRQTLLGSVIAITGSVGKTTTRRMVSSIVSSQFKVHETEDNKNNLVGVPLTLLAADDSDEVIIAEMGMDRHGEIETLSRLAHPDVAILTGIGYSHAEYLGSREAILKEKTDIIVGMKRNGLLLINGQDPQLNAWALSKKHDLAIWRVSDDPSYQAPGLETMPSFWAEEIRISPRETSFTAYCSIDPDFKAQVTIPAPGRYLVRAALFGLATAYALGFDMDKAIAGCQNFRNTGSRQLIREIGSYLLIDDSYNASPESTTAALDTSCLVAEERRVFACIGGMKELGSYAEELHRKIGEHIASCGIDQLVLIGEEADWIVDGLKASGYENPVNCFATSDEAIPFVLEQLKDGDCILLKGSRCYKVEKIVKAIEAISR